MDFIQGSALPFVAAELRYLLRLAYKCQSLEISLIISHPIYNKNPTKLVNNSAVLEMYEEKERFKPGGYMSQIYPFPQLNIAFKLLFSLPAGDLLLWLASYLHN